MYLIGSIVRCRVQNPQPLPTGLQSVGNTNKEVTYADNGRLSEALRDKLVIRSYIKTLVLNVTLCLFSVFYQNWEKNLTEGIER